MNRAYYSATVEEFLKDTDETIIGSIVPCHSQEIVHQQTRAWEEQIPILKEQLAGFADGHIAFEALIPRMGKRADAVFLYKGIVFVLEFKVGEKEYRSGDIAQAEGYCIDFQYFHEGSQDRLIVPILVATGASHSIKIDSAIEKKIAAVQKSNGKNIEDIISFFTESGDCNRSSEITMIEWLSSRYKPTPTIIEAARALYSNHRVEDISRSDAEAENISKTTSELNKVISYCHTNTKKAICFVTGVPGAGKTLVGLNIATQPTSDDEEIAVYLSGNGPLVNVLREALIQDQIQLGSRRAEIEPRVKASIQNVHHFRSQYGLSEEEPPERVVIFDEAQRAWDEEHLTKSKPVYKGLGSEPDILLTSMDRKEDWCVVVALIGSGQEINSGEVGVLSWMTSIKEKFPHWEIFHSNNIKNQLLPYDRINCIEKKEFHLSVSQRSFRATNLASFVDALLSTDTKQAKRHYEILKDSYPLTITRDLEVARSWIKGQCRVNERMGILSSSSGKRLRACGIINTKEVDEKNWFLKPAADVRSSNFLEEAVSEFKVQGLELDWTILGWDADLRYTKNGFKYYNFSGTKWTTRHQEQSRKYLENAYRVLLTRARQGMVIYVPYGNNDDGTRLTAFYDETYNYLKSCGIEVID